MNNVKKILKSCSLLAVMSIATIDLCHAQDESDKIAQSQRPGFFKELAKTKIVCMRSCPKKIDNLFGIKVICGNYEQSLFDSSCLTATGHTPVEYCNCDDKQCAKFHAECSADGTICEVKMGSIGISHAACECNGNTCEAAGTGFANSSCFMRKDVDSKTCKIHRMVAFSDGRSYHIACDNEKTACVSEGMRIDNSIGIGRLPTEKKPGELK